jgi:hypothetical protein
MGHIYIGAYRCVLAGRLDELVYSHPGGSRNYENNSMNRRGGDSI